MNEKNQANRGNSLRHQRCELAYFRRCYFRQSQWRLLVVKPVRARPRISKLQSTLRNKAILVIEYKGRHFAGAVKAAVTIAKVLSCLYFTRFCVPKWFFAGNVRSSESGRERTGKTWGDYKMRTVGYCGSCSWLAEATPRPGFELKPVTA